MNTPLFAVASAALLVALPGCMHKVQTGRLDQTDGWAIQGNKTIDGVLFYEPAQVVVRREFTRFELNGIIPLGTDGNPVVCTRVVEREEIVLLPDLTKPVALLNKPSWFASGKMEVQLSSGMLQSLNTDSNPELAEIVTALKGGVAPEPAQPTGATTMSNIDATKTTFDTLAKKGLKPACNASPEIAKVRPVPL